MDKIYDDGTYKCNNSTWHVEDSGFKAKQILATIDKHQLQPTSITEVGCGAGMVLDEIANSGYLPSSTTYLGYDTSKEAIALCPEDTMLKKYIHGDPFAARTETPDLLLAIDVLEHVPDYMGFLHACRDFAEYKIYHIPLELHVSSVARASFLEARQKVGHLHYFSAESALAVLSDTGHEVIDSGYTYQLDNGPATLGVGEAVVARLRRGIGMYSSKYAARMLGGFSLLVLAR